MVRVIHNRWYLFATPALRRNLSTREPGLVSQLIATNNRAVLATGGRIGSEGTVTVAAGNRNGYKQYWWGVKLFLLANAISGK